MYDALDRVATYIDNFYGADRKWNFVNDIYLLMLEPFSYIILSYAVNYRKERLLLHFSVITSEKYL